MESEMPDRSSDTNSTTKRYLQQLVRVIHGGAQPLRRPWRCGPHERTRLNSDAAAITLAVETQLEAARQVITLGGDHSITYPILQAFRQRHDDLTVVHIDAHPDLYDDLDGNPLSHA